MSEGSEKPINPRVDTEIAKEFIRKGTILWENDHCQVLAPENPLTPKSEGIHLRVVLKKELSPFWDKNTDVKEILSAFAIGLGVSKALAESGYSGENMWANIQLLSEWGGQFEPIIDVFGRAIENPQGGTSWGGPVPMPEEEQLPTQKLTPEEIKNFRRLFHFYLPLWNRALKETRIFPDGTGKTDVAAVTHEGETIHWVGDKYYITSVNKPHVEGGGHLVVHKRPDTGKLPRIWHNLTEALEMLSLDLATVQLLSEKGLIPANPPNVNIYFSGNWALPYSKRDKVDPNSKLSETEKDFLSRTQQALQEGRWPKVFKIEARKGFTRLGAHGHIYWTREGERLVLPKHPQGETYKWTHSQEPLPPATLEKISAVLNQKLPSLITEKFSGKVVRLFE